MSTLRDRLRTLPAFPADLPVLDLETVPEDPNALFTAWLEDAIDAGGRQPHAMTFMTALGDGTPVGRTLILKDIDEHGYHVSTRRTSRKGRQLAENPRAAMLFFWRESGRQVHITGDMNALDEEISQADWLERPTSDGRPNLEWQVYALLPTSFEFLQAGQDRNHTRVEYRRDQEGWTHAPVTTPAG